MEMIGMDIVNPKKKLYFLRFIDYYSRLGFVFHTKDKTTKEIIKKFAQFKGVSTDRIFFQ